MKLIEIFREKVLNLPKIKPLLTEKISIQMRTLKPEEVIGYPTRDDYPLLNGKEVMVEAVFKETKGQAFTDEPFDISTSIKNILNLPLMTNRDRALFIATTNALLKYIGLIDKTIHCKNEQPEICAGQIAKDIYENYGKNTKIVLIGLQPAIAESLIKYFSSKNIRLFDLDKKNIGKNFSGVIVENGKYISEEKISDYNIILATGSTIVNNTIDNIIHLSDKEKVTFFGVTIAGASKLLNLKNYCFKAS